MTSSLTTAHIKTVISKLKKMAILENRCFREVLTRFLMERALVRIASDPSLSKSLIFTGDLVVSRVFGVTRSTNAIDALIHDMFIDNVSELIKSALSEDIGDGTWFYISGEGTVADRLQFEFNCGLGKGDSNCTGTLFLSMTRTASASSSILRETPLTIGQGKLSWRIQPLETMVAKKLINLTQSDASTSKANDLYDIDFMWPQVRIPMLVISLKAILMDMSRPLPKSFAVVLKYLDLNITEDQWRLTVCSLRYPPTAQVVLNNLLSKISALDDALAHLT